MKRTPLLAAVVLACTATPGLTAELSERGTEMFDAMLGAMDAMGLVERGRKHRSEGGDGSSGFNMPGGSSFGGWPSAMPGASPFGMPGASPFGMPGASPFGGFGNPMSPWSSIPGAGSSMPWTGGGMPWTGGGMPWGGGKMPDMARMPGGSGWPMPAMPNGPWTGAQKGSTASAFLDGAWEGQGGELLLIRRGMFRIYADAETYRDGHLQIQGERLQLKDAESGRARDYEMRYQADQLALRTPEGDVLLYRRMSDDAQGR